MTTPSLEAIRPWSLGRVMDLVEAAGIDVSDWANFSRGAKWAAANPKYCYEWAFRGNGRIVVNMWLEDMEVRDSRIVLSGNIRENVASHRRPGGKGVWRRRGEATDAAIRSACELGIPLRMIICRGKLRDRDDPSAKASKVDARGLDPIPWTVQSYDDGSGAFLLVRGGSPGELVDQFDLPEIPDGPTERRTSTHQAFVRSAQVRLAVLRRADGHCEWCGQPGFRMPEERIFLETHHIKPLSEGGLDRINNVAALCPNHHREAHHGEAHERIRVGLQKRLRQSTIDES